MKSRTVLSGHIKQLAVETANREVDKQARDITRRNIYMFCLALHNVGISSKTLMRAIDNLNEQVVPAYGEYRRDGVADAALTQAVAAIGLPVEQMESEL